VEGVHTYYGESHVLQGISLRVDPGEVLAILGRNGMGKTTLIRTIVGFTPPREGRVRYKDTEITRLPPFRMVELGMALVPQGRRVFASLSVRENLEVARRGAGRWSLEQVYALFPRLRERAGNRANKLSGGEQQMLAIGRALMARPKLMLLDEPSLGLSPILVKEIFGIIRRLNQEQKVTMLLVEQNANMALKAADYGYIMEGGKVVLDGPAESLMNNEDVKEFYLGGGSGERRSFKNLKSFKRRKRWL